MIKRMGKFDWCAVIEKQWCNLWKRQNVLSLQPELRLIFRPETEIQTFFPPKIRWSPNKKGLQKLIFRPNSEIQTFEGGCFPMGWGLFSIFHKNRPQKHQKRAILHTSQANGGARAPPRPLATLLSEGLHPTPFRYQQ